MSNAAESVASTAAWRVILAGAAVAALGGLVGLGGAEFRLPLLLMFGLDLKLAGSVSLAVSLPTMLAGFARYSRDSSFAVLRTHQRFVWTMTAGSLLGSAAGGLMVGVVPTGVLLPALAVVLVASAARIWRDH
jgi:uncharacterized membrane protein YfcA